MSKFVVGRNPSKIQWHGGAMKAIGGHGFHVLFYSFMWANSKWFSPLKAVETVRSPLDPFH